MLQYKIFKHPAGNIEAVKQGWSWPAFFFTFIWALVKKEWPIGFATMIAFFALGVALETAGVYESSEGLISIASIILNFIFGVNGNRWRVENLISRGYDHVDTVTAANPDGAVALYLKALNVNSGP